MEVETETRRKIPLTLEELDTAGFELSFPERNKVNTKIPVGLFRDNPEADLWYRVSSKDSPLVHIGFIVAPDIEQVTSFVTQPDPNVERALQLPQESVYSARVIYALYDNDFDRVHRAIEWKRFLDGKRIPYEEDPSFEKFTERLKSEITEYRRLTRETKKIHDMLITDRAQNAN